MCRGDVFILKALNTVEEKKERKTPPHEQCTVNKYDLQLLNSVLIDYLCVALKTQG